MRTSLTFQFPGGIVPIEQTKKTMSAESQVHGKRIFKKPLKGSNRTIFLGKSLSRNAANENFCNFK